MSKERFQMARNGVLAALTLVLGLGGLMTARTAVTGRGAVATLSPTATPASGFAPVVKRGLPAVVSINVVKVTKTSGDAPDADPMLRRFFGGGFPGMEPRDRRQGGSGSGVLVSADGYLLTNHHVIDGATQIQVVLSDRREFKAKVIGSDPKTDVAVLKIDAESLPFLSFADSSKVQVGDYAIAIGNPFGVGQTVTLGIVSATGRSNLGIEDYEEFIQTDAAINPGNSGGALANSNGDLIGINTAILSPGSGGNNGVGFAIPSNLARNIMEQIVRSGKVTRAQLGIRIQPLTPALAQALGAPGAQGALVGEVSPGSPAERAGLEKGDVITGLNGEKLADSAQLRNRVALLAPGSRVELQILRDGKERKLEARLEEQETRTARVAKPEAAPAENGVDVEALTPRLARQLNLPPDTRGVVVTAVDPDSAAAEAGLRRGDVIQEVNRRPVKDEESFRTALGRKEGGNLLLVRREGATLFLAA